MRLSRPPLPAGLFEALFVACVTLFATPAFAAELTWRISSREAYVGSRVYLEVTVADAGELVPPATPMIDGASAKLLPGSRTMTSTSIINGQARTTKTTTFVFEIEPERTGRINIPPIEVRADGRALTTPFIPIVANQSETGDLLMVEVGGSPPDPLVGQETTLTLTILVRRFRSDDGNAALGEEDMWKLLDLDGSKLGFFKPAFIELAQARRRPLGREELVDDRAYFVYEVARSWRPSRPGPPDLGELEIVLNWPTGTRRVRDFFGSQRLEVSGLRPVVAGPAPYEIAARPLPEEGRPADFIGAIGRFAVEASAKPVEVSVGDPITVTFRVRSSDPGSLDGVRLPPFHLDPAVAAGFRVPSDDVAGTITGDAKVFTQTFRPLSDEVKEIPPLRLSSFDPATNAYATVETRPIPISVSPSERLSLNRIVGGRAESPAATVPALTPLAGGLVANAARDETVRSLYARGDGPGLVTLATITGLPPLAAATVVAVAAARARRERDPLRFRAKTAFRTADARLRAGDADAPFDALAGFLGDRFGLPEGRRTRAEVVAALDAARCPEPLRRRAAETLAALEAARYRSGGPPPDAAAVRTLLGELDRATRGGVA